MSHLHCDEASEGVRRGGCSAGRDGMTEAGRDPARATGEGGTIMEMGRMFATELDAIE